MPLLTGNQLSPALVDLNTPFPLLPQKTVFEEGTAYTVNIIPPSTPALTRAHCEKEFE